jgi:restriction system protein
LTEEAARRRAALTGILLEALQPRLAVDWSAFYDRTEFDEPPPAQPAPLEIVREPQAEEFRPVPEKKPPLLARMFPPRKADLPPAARAAFRNAQEEWKLSVRWKANEHAKALQHYQAALLDWDARKNAFLAVQSKANARIDTLRRRYADGDVGAIAAACDLALLTAPRPEGFPRFWRIAFDVDRALMTVNYELPAPDMLPAVRGVKYREEYDAFETIAFNAGETAALYEETVYQSVLAALHLIFAADPGETVRAVAFNGWANFVDAAAGCPARTCILSLHVTKEAFRGHDLAGVDPGACFRALGGVAGPRLAAMEPVSPIAKPR